ncbi:hypothetical protein DFP72DRAFT_844859 [Ephemerocybe angulata]|uniref:Uncharacterized protein n=1 Tax=Ephemerocybe angulata TaxID=980116 RepID=A0A8H6I5U4_9AGAR|nr:hypothetical protein DFP72DRAFT_844859 [Tulosesus angulatus]
MHFKVSAIVSAALVYATAVVQAVDLRTFAATTCAGPALVCGNLAQRQCCTSGGNPWASQRLSSGGIATTCLTHTAASPLPHSPKPYAPAEPTPSLARPASALALLFSLAGRGELLSGRAEDLAAASNSTGKCVEPDSYGLLDSAGEFHQAKIPKEKREEIYAAFAKNDVEYFKAAF